MHPSEYKIRCDKHNYKPYEYCEMCWLRNEVFESVEKARKDTRSLLADTHLAINVLNDYYFKMERQINEIMERLK